jgi:hypothetical protein
VDDLHLAPSPPKIPSRPDRLRERFLRGEAGGEVLCGVGAGKAVALLFLPEGGLEAVGVGFLHHRVKARLKDELRKMAVRGTLDSGEKPDSHDPEIAPEDVGQVIDTSLFADPEIDLLLDDFLGTLPEKMRQFGQLLLEGASDDALMEELAMSRAAVYQMRHRLRELYDACRRGGNPPPPHK